MGFPDVISMLSAGWRSPESSLDGHTRSRWYPFISFGFWFLLGIDFIFIRQFLYLPSSYVYVIRYVVAFDAFSIFCCFPVDVISVTYRRVRALSGRWVSVQFADTDIYRYYCCSIVEMWLPKSSTLFLDVHFLKLERKYLRRYIFSENGLTMSVVHLSYHPTPPDFRIIAIGICRMLRPNHENFQHGKVSLSWGAPRSMQRQSATGISSGQFCRNEYDSSRRFRCRPE